MRSSKPGCSGSVRVNIEGFSHFEQGGRKLLEFFRRSAIVLTETSSRGQRLYPIAEESDDPIQSFGSARFYFLATMSDKLIKDLKQAAISLDKSASQCLEEATAEWLERHAKAGKP
jgi:hypothetical protein